MLRSAREIKEEGERLFSMLMPDRDSVSVREEMWDHWEKSGVARPDVGGIVDNQSKREQQFFDEIVALARGEFDDKRLVLRCSVSLDTYNFATIPASDGSVILVDDMFLQLLFVLCNVLMVKSDAKISQDDHDRLNLWAREIVIETYIKKRRIDYMSHKDMLDFLLEDYDLAEAANYLFQGMQGFAMAHELGHHLLEHAPVGTTIHMLPRKTAEPLYLECEMQSHLNEHAADAFGYRVYRQMKEIKDAESTLYCRYWYNFCPILLFEICAGLERLKLGKNPPATQTHPTAQARISSLRSLFDTGEYDDLYAWCRRSVHDIFGTASDGGQ